ncbi:hypothetical protein Tco_0905187 [Tanacetum coccineum]
MFDPPLSDDAIWSLPLQQKMINWSNQTTNGHQFTMSNGTSRIWIVPKQTALALATPEQTATGKEISNPLTADSLLKTIRLSMHLVTAMKH